MMHIIQVGVTGMNWSTRWLSGSRDRHGVLGLVAARDGRPGRTGLHHRSQWSDWEMRRRVSLEMRHRLEHGLVLEPGYLARPPWVLAGRRG